MHLCLKSCGLLMAEPALENFHCVALWISLMLICLTLLFLYGFLAKTFLELLYGEKKSFSVAVCLLAELE